MPSLSRELDAIRVSRGSVRYFLVPPTPCNQPLPRAAVNPQQAYDEMIALSRAESLLASCLDVLEWDE